MQCHNYSKGSCQISHSLSIAKANRLVIDALETPVATAEIVSVGAKLSYARVIEGDVAKIAVGARLRRVPVPAVPPPPPPLTTTVRPNGTGGVVTPF